MTYDSVISYFRTQANVAIALGVKQPAVAQWKRKKGGLIPELQARKLAEKYPELKFDASAYQNH
ncbi:Cro/CI family transcriptional regulator [Vibrio sp. YQ_11]|uniref:Cro/CI family transcriptional regulator n=1 Tax=unclassified Vibrio TaxID=2614977 RepID=UPI001F89186F|nr:hypothetical protein CTH30272_04109 [Catenococcus thiocycli]